MIQDGQDKSGRGFLRDVAAAEQETTADELEIRTKAKAAKADLSIASRDETARLGSR
jgi:hypothetical protein